MTANVLSLLGLAHKAGKVEIGEEPVAAAARAKHARVIFLAQDAAPSTQRRAAHFAEQGACLFLRIDADKDALGSALGRTNCAMCAVTDIGFACALVQKLAATDERYRSALERLEVKAQRALARRREQQLHEKNVKRGKKRSNAPAAPQSTQAQPTTPEKKTAEKPRRTAPKRFTPRPKKQDSRSRFAASLPVKKGKGSKKTAVKRGKD